MKESLPSRVYFLLFVETFTGWVISLWAVMVTVCGTAIQIAKHILHCGTANSNTWKNMGMYCDWKAYFQKVPRFSIVGGRGFRKLTNQLQLKKRALVGFGF